MLLRTAQITICQSLSLVLSHRKLGLAPLLYLITHFYLGDCAQCPFLLFFMYKLSQHWAAGELTSFWKQFWGPPKFQRVQKTGLLWSLPGRAAAAGCAEVLIPLPAEYLLHPSISKPVPPVGDSHPWACRNQVCAPYCPDRFQLRSIWRDSSAFPLRAPSHGLLEEWHSICFFSLVGWRHKYFWQTAWACEIAKC